MKKRIEAEIDGFAARVLRAYRLRDGLTGYVHDDNRQRDLRHMQETMRQELPLLLDRLGVTEYIIARGEE